MDSLVLKKVIDENERLSQLTDERSRSAGKDRENAQHLFLAKRKLICSALRRTPALRSCAVLAEARVSENNTCEIAFSNHSYCVAQHRETTKSVSFCLRHSTGD